ncbi:MAG TPA: hypothetical protein VFD30_06270 [Terriglobia bacterium]|jgi:hypothetical protein|nr:hypothetical protein [Terriglobia bacterium]
MATKVRKAAKYEALRAIEGLTFGDCVEFFGEQDSRERRIAKLARKRLTDPGELEIDEPTVLSEGDDNGAYVMAWAWVDFDGVPGLDKGSGS